MLHCKIYVALHPDMSYTSGYRVSLLLCFLGRFLPKLGGTSVPPFFSLNYSAAGAKR